MLLKKTKKNLHISSPKTHVSGLVLTSTKTVGVQTNKTKRSAILKFVRNMLVELRISFVFSITIGTYKLNFRFIFISLFLHYFLYIKIIIGIEGTYHNISYNTKTHNNNTEYHRCCPDV